MGHITKVDNYYFSSFCEKESRKGRLYFFSPQKNASSTQFPNHFHFKLFPRRLLIPNESSNVLIGNNCATGTNDHPGT